MMMGTPKTMMRRLLFLPVLIAGAIATGPASGAEKAPISSLPTMPAPHDAKDPPKDYGVAGLTIKEKKTYGSTSYTDLTVATSRGYCIANREFGLRLTSSSSGPEDELWRFVEKDGKATLERTRFELASYLTNAWVKSRTSIELREVAKSNGVTVWGFREASGDVVLLARSADGGRESPRPKKDDERSFEFVSSDCTFGATRLNSAAARAGAVAQLRGSLPPIGDGKQKVIPRYVVDGSLAKVARDPEPVLAVRIRLVD